MDTFSVSRYEPNMDVGFFGTGAIDVVPTLLRRYLKANPGVDIIMLNVPQPA